MKLRTLAAAVILSASFAAPAFAATVSVALQNPVETRTKIIAGGAVFSCLDTACVAQNAPTRAVTARACKALADEVGPISAFSSKRKTLEADDLATCNGVAPATLTASN